MPARSRSASFASLLRAGQRALQQLSPSAALQPLRRALQLRPDAEEALDAMADALGQMGLLEEQKEVLGRALRVAPNGFSRWLAFAQLQR